jgi:hypothetical protein
MNGPGCINHCWKTIHAGLQQHFIIDLLPDCSADLEAISPKQDEPEMTTFIIALAHLLVLRVDELCVQRDRLLNSLTNR